MAGADFQRIVEENRSELEALAESDNPAAPVGRAVLSAADGGGSGG